MILCCHFWNKAIMGKINDFELQIDERRGQHRREDASYQPFALFMMSDEEKNDLQCLSPSLLGRVFIPYIS